MQCIITEPTSVRSEDLTVSVAQNSECVGLGIPRWHCVQGAAGTGLCCSKHTRERDCLLSRASRQATTPHIQMQFARSQGLNFRSIHLQTRGRVRYGGFLYATAASCRPRAESKPPACSMNTHKHNRTLQKRPEQLPTGLSFCTK